MVQSLWACASSDDVVGALRLDTCEYGSAGLATVVCVRGAAASTAALGLMAIDTIKNAPPKIYEYVNLDAAYCISAQDCSRARHRWSATSAGRP